MSDELQSRLNDLANKIGAAIKDASTLTVRTYAIPFGTPVEANWRDGATGIAVTEVKIDADCDQGIPIDSNGRISEALLAAHHNAVAHAVEARTALIRSLVELIKTLRP